MEKYESSYIVEDEFEELDNEPVAYSGDVRRSGRAYRREKSKQKQSSRIRLFTTYGRAGYVDCQKIDGTWVPIGRYVKFPKDSHRQRFYKRYSNRRIRCGCDLGSGKGGYKRCFDYRWEID